MEKEEKEEMKKVRKINIEDFFTDDNENNGVWFEPVINGEKCGIEFLVTGANTDENAENAERYSKNLAALEDIKDMQKKSAKKKDLDAKRVAQFIKGMRPAPDCEIDFGGKTIEYTNAMIEKLLYKAPLIQSEILSFAYKTANFMAGKKN